MNTPAPGVLLIADPFLKDPNFMRTVIFLCEHQDEGSFGFVLNRIFDRTLDQLFPELEGYRLPVHFGGPVQLDSVHFLHQYPELIPGGICVCEGIYWGGEFEDVIRLLRSGDIDPAKIRFFIGYSGWGEGQLADEMKEKSYFIVISKKSGKNRCANWVASLHSSSITPLIRS
jgi:putative transcriptional regulator